MSSVLPRHSLKKFRLAVEAERALTPKSSSGILQQGNIHIQTPVYFSSASENEAQVNLMTRFTLS